MGVDSAEVILVSGISGPLVICLDLSESPCIFDICEQVLVLVRLTVCFPHGFDGKQISRFVLLFFFSICVTGSFSYLFLGSVFKMLVFVRVSGQVFFETRFRTRFWSGFLRGSFSYAFLVRFFKRLVFVRVFGQVFKEARFRTRFWSGF